MNTITLNLTANPLVYHQVLSGGVELDSKTFVELLKLYSTPRKPWLNEEHPIWAAARVSELAIEAAVAPAVERLTQTGIRHNVQYFIGGPVWLVPALIKVFQVRNLACVFDSGEGWEDIPNLKLEPDRVKSVLDKVCV